MFVSSTNRRKVLLVPSETDAPFNGYQQNSTNKKQREVRWMIEDALLLYLESMHREKRAKKKKGHFHF